MDRLKDMLELKTNLTCRTTKIMGFQETAASRCRPMPGTLRNKFRNGSGPNSDARPQSGARNGAFPSNLKATRPVCRRDFRAAFDTQEISLYATKTQWAAVCKSHPSGKILNGPFVHSRDLYMLLPGQCRAGVFNGLDSETVASEHQRPTAQICAVGLSILG